MLHIPANLPLDGAAPLLCAGITVYSPLKHYQSWTSRASRSASSASAASATWWEHTPTSAGTRVRSSLAAVPAYSRHSSLCSLVMSNAVLPHVLAALLCGMLPSVGVTYALLYAQCNRLGSERGLSDP